MVKALEYYILLFAVCSLMVCCAPEEDVYPMDRQEGSISIRSSKPLTIHISSGDSLVILESTDANYYYSRTINNIITLPIGMNQKYTDYDFYYPDYIGTLRLTYSLKEHWNKSGVLSIVYEDLKVDTTSTFDKLYKTSRLTLLPGTSKYYFEYSDQINEPNLLYNTLKQSTYNSSTFYLDEYL
ncbi:MAG: hypothetical protein ACPGYY_02710 [Bacteroidia bacterium]